MAAAEFSAVCSPSYTLSNVVLLPTAAAHPRDHQTPDRRRGNRVANSPTLPITLVTKSQNGHGRPVLRFCVHRPPLPHLVLNYLLWKNWRCQPPQEIIWKLDSCRPRKLDHANPDHRCGTPTAVYDSGKLGNDSPLEFHLLVNSATLPFPFNKTELPSPRLTPVTFWSRIG